MSDELSNISEYSMNELSESQLKALDKCLPVLCENLDLTRVLAQLERQGDIGCADVQSIKAEYTEYDQRRKLIELIKTKQASFYAVFQKALLSSGQIHSAELLSHTVLEGTVSLMSHFHPDWWSRSTKKETVCIPVSLDVDKNRYLGASDCRASNFNSETFSRKERQWSGQAAEDIFIKAFQLLNIGGILIFGLDTMELASVRRTQKLFRKRRISQIECDFIFIHPSMGIFVIELKSTKQSIEEYSPVYQHAIRTTKKIKEQIPIIYELLTGRKFNIPLYGAVCFPLANVSGFARDETIELIESFHEGHPGSLKNVFMNKMRQESLEEESLIGLKMFASSLAAYRSAECISPVHNALAINAMLKGQSFFSSTSQGACFKNGVLITDEQLAVIECKDRHQIITGPPGSAKTLILLNKAINMAKVDKPGRVCIVTFNKLCCKIFQQHFELNSDDIIRTPTVGYTLNSVFPEDDLFIDEADLQSEAIISFLKDRQSASGLTFVAVTGFQWPCQIIHSNQESNLAFYRHFDLNTVIRGTKSIVDTWTQEQPSCHRFHMGHSIIGPPVIKAKVETTDEVLSKLLDSISQAVNSAAATNLCIITENERNCKIIKEFLSRNKVDCGSLEEQLTNSNVIAVAEYRETLSLEWPLVFIVALECSDQHDSFIKVAASRAIAKLMIFEVNWTKVQAETDDQVMRDHLVELKELTCGQFERYAEKFCEPKKRSPGVRLAVI